MSFFRDKIRKLIENRYAWEKKLQKILDKTKRIPGEHDTMQNDNSMITIVIDELPTATEIVRNSHNHALLKFYLERLKYLLLSEELADESRVLLKSFIDNCQKELGTEKRKKLFNETPLWLWFRLWLVVILWLIASFLPIASLRYIVDSNAWMIQQDKGMYIERNKKIEKDSEQTSSTEKNLPIPKEKVNPYLVVGCIFSGIIYLAFYAILTLLMFKMIKNIREHRRHQMIHRDLSSLVAILSVKIEANDIARLQARKTILKTLLLEEHED